VAQVITDKAVDYIENNTGTDKPPFFLYFAHNIPHGAIRLFSLILYIDA
tara:strand:+ start:495 stop:641 length:147 start_codon:yes stop_codon:yes gene_type:complete